MYKLIKGETKIFKEMIENEKQEAMKEELLRSIMTGENQNKKNEMKTKFFSM